MLDVFASAMGAFLILVAIILPYYHKDHQELMSQIQEFRRESEQHHQRIQQLENENRNLREQNQQQQNKIEQLENQNRNLQEQLAKTFLIVVIDWKTQKHDVDLHVIDPSGNEFFFKKKSFPGVPGKLSEDTINGPGVEVWEILDAPAGDYKVYYNFFEKHGNLNSTVVKGRVYFRDGKKDFRDITISQEKEKPEVTTINVSDDGIVTVQP